jgi:4-amino-4-deoxy-L-arabinose transferase-like glycosyltransferase
VRPIATGTSTEAPKRSSPAILAAVALAYAVVLFLAAPPWPDDWDGIGFVQSMTRFDLGSFQPHAPGYPVYVALLRIAARVWGPSALATATVAALAGGVTIFAAGSALVRFAGRSATSSVLLLAATPLVFHTNSGVGSEAPALAFYALACWALVLEGAAHRPRFAAAGLGLAVALGLGTRLSWAPLYLPLLLFVPRGRRAQVCGGLAVGTLVWLVPFVLAVGPAELLALMRTQATGHFTRWGGSELTEPGAMRVVFFGRDLFVDGLGAGADALGIAIALVVAALAFVGVSEWAEAEFPHARAVALALGPYALWVLVGQNVAAQPRHLVPLVAVLALALAETTRRVSRAHILGVALGILFASRSAIDAEDRRATAPPAVQMLDAVDALAPDASGRAAVLFGGASARFAEVVRRPSTDGAPRVEQAATMGDVELAAGKLDHLPATLLVTSEITGATPPRGAKPFGKYCRPERLDRRTPCLTTVRIPSGR